jgi:hypothetical protein
MAVVFAKLRKSSEFIFLQKTTKNLERLLLQIPRPWTKRKLEAFSASLDAEPGTEFHDLGKKKKGMCVTRACCAQILVRGIARCGKRQTEHKTQSSEAQKGKTFLSPIQAEEINSK